MNNLTWLIIPNGGVAHNALAALGTVDSTQGTLLSFFYLAFSSLAIVSAIMVIGATNPVHSVLFLVLVFISVSGILFLLGAEVLALLFIIVYVGAIAILFLFVVMMLPTHGKRPTGQLVSTYLPLVVILGATISLSLIIYPILSMNKEVSLTEMSLPSVIWSGDVLAYLAATGVDSSTNSLTYLSSLEGLSNIDVLGRLLYNEFASFFLVSGLILLVSMIGAIVLTMHRRGDVKRQEYYQQIARDFRTTVVSVK